MRGLFSMRATWLVGWAAAWNGLLILAGWFNDWHRQIQDARAALLACVVFAGTTALFGAILFSERVRDRIIAPSRQAMYEPRPFWIFAVISATLALVILLESTP